MLGDGLAAAISWMGARASGEVQAGGCFASFSCARRLACCMQAEREAIMPKIEDFSSRLRANDQCERWLSSADAKIRKACALGLGAGVVFTMPLRMSARASSVYLWIPSPMPLTIVTLDASNSEWLLSFALRIFDPRLLYIRCGDGTCLVSSARISARVSQEPSQSQQRDCRGLARRQGQFQSAHSVARKRCRTWPHELLTRSSGCRFCSRHLLPPARGEQGINPDDSMNFRAQPCDVSIREASVRFGGFVCRDITPHSKHTTSAVEEPVSPRHRPVRQEGRHRFRVSSSACFTQPPALRLGHLHGQQHGHGISALQSTLW